MSAISFPKKVDKSYITAELLHAAFCIPNEPIRLRYRPPVKIN